MKKAILLITMSLLIMTSFAQKDSLNYSQLNGKEKPKGIFSTYIGKENITFSIGDTLWIGKPTGVNQMFNYVFTTKDKFVPWVWETTIKDFVIIKSIKIDGSSKTGWTVYLITEDGFSITADLAKENGEIKF